MKGIYSNLSIREALSMSPDGVATQRDDNQKVVWIFIQRTPTTGDLLKVGLIDGKPVMRLGQNTAYINGLDGLWNAAYWKERK